MKSFLNISILVMGLVHFSSLANADSSWRHECKGTHPNGAQVWVSDERSEEIPGKRNIQYQVDDPSSVLNHVKVSVDASAKVRTGFTFLSGQRVEVTLSYSGRLPNEDHPPTVPNGTIELKLFSAISSDSKIVSDSKVNLLCYSRIGGE